MGNNRSGSLLTLIITSVSPAQCLPFYLFILKKKGSLQHQQLKDPKESQTNKYVIDMKAQHRQHDVTV